MECVEAVAEGARLQGPGPADRRGFAFNRGVLGHRGHVPSKPPATIDWPSLSKGVGGVRKTDSQAPNPAHLPEPSHHCLAVNPFGLPIGVGWLSSTRTGHCGGECR